MGDADDFGRRLADAGAKASMDVEAARFRSNIYHMPVELEPAFNRLDPYQTYMNRQKDFSIPAIPAESEWGSRRLLVPKTPVSPASFGLPFVGLAGVPGTVAFEAVLTRNDLQLFVTALPEALEFAANAWQLAYPEGLTIPSTDPFVDLPSLPVVMDWYAMASYHQRVIAPVSLWGQLVRVAAEFGPADKLVYQVLSCPARQAWQQNIEILSRGHRGVTDTKSLSEPLRLAAIRVGMTNKGLQSLLSSLPGIFTSGGSPFAARKTEDFLSVLSPESVQGMFRQRSSFTLGQLLTSGELGLFCHPPAADLAAEKVRLPIRCGLPVPERLQHIGFVLGINTDTGKPINVCYPLADKAHASIVGMTGTRKSTFIEHLIRSVAEAGYGCCFIDPHGQNAEGVIGTLGNVRDRVVYLNFDQHPPVAYNAFRGVDPEDYGRYALDFVQTVTPLFETEGYFRLNHILGNGMYGLCVLGENVGTLPILYERTNEGQALRSRIITDVRNDDVRKFWRDEYPQYAPSVFTPIYNRFMPVRLDDRTRRVLSQRENKVDIPAMIRERKVLIIKMPSSMEAQRLIGGFLIGQIKHTALRRKSTEHQFYLFVDEHHRFSGSGSSFQEIIDQTRKGRLSLVLANQTTSQIPAELSRSIMGLDTFVFGLSNNDKKEYASLFGGRVDPDVLRDLPPGAVYARIGSDIVNFTVPAPPVFDPTVAAHIIRASIAQYHADGTDQHPAVVVGPSTPRPRRPRMFEALDE